MPKLICYISYRQHAVISMSLSWLYLYCQLLAKFQKVWCPTITTAGSSGEWSYFLTHWGNYIEATKVNGKDSVIQLLKCFDEELRKDFRWSAGGSLTNKMEDEVFAAINTLAVHKENTMVARVALYEMRQDRWNHPFLWCSCAWPSRSLQIPIKLPHLQHWGQIHWPHSPWRHRKGHLRLGNRTRTTWSHESKHDTWGSVPIYQSQRGR